MLPVGVVVASSGDLNSGVAILLSCDVFYRVARCCSRMIVGERGYHGALPRILSILRTVMLSVAVVVADDDVSGHGAR